MDDAWEAAAGLGLDGQDVTITALRDDGLL